MFAAAASAAAAVFASQLGFLLRCAFEKTSRFEQQVYVPLPDESARRELINILVNAVASSLTAEDVEEVAQDTEGKIQPVVIF